MRNDLPCCPSCGAVTNENDRKYVADLVNRLRVQLEEERTKVARLERVLAVERGDESAAPEGWSRKDGDWYRSGGYWVSRWGPGDYVYHHLDTGEEGGFSTALEAMEAAAATLEKP